MSENFCLTFEKFKLQNERFLKDPIVNSFLENSTHYQLFMESLCKPSKDIEEKLNNAFQKFYTNIKVVNYLAKTVYWEAINYDKNRRKQMKHELLLVSDDNSSENNQIRKIEMPESNTFDFSISRSSKSLKESIENIDLYDAYIYLTERQKEILNYIYIHELTNIEIAQNLNISQQGVSRIHQQALKKMKKYMSERKDRNGTNTNMEELDRKSAKW